MIRRMLVASLLLIACGCNKPEPAPAQAGSDTPAPAIKPAFAPIGAAYLHNAHRINDKVISGAQPEGEESFKELAGLGVRTIVSVDGAQPDVELARKYGMKYVHVPTRYNGVTTEQGQAVAKALMDMPGSVYVHCHHGKHRSAAAAAVACVVNGMLPPEKAESVLQTFGTGANYTGLWKAAREARPMDAQALKDLKVDLVEARKLPAIARAMVTIDEHWDALKLIQKAGWKTPTDHPDLDPAHEALQVHELLRDLRRTEETRTQPEKFQQMLAANEEQVGALHKLLKAGGAEKGALDAAMKTASGSCTACHQAYRD